MSDTLKKLLARHGVTDADAFLREHDGKVRDEVAALTAQLATAREALGKIGAMRSSPRGYAGCFRVCRNIANRTLAALDAQNTDTEGTER